MPVPTQRKRSRRAMINAGRPISEHIRFATPGRLAVSPVFHWLAAPVEGGTHRRATISKDSYEHCLRLLPDLRAEYRKYLDAGEPNIFA